MLPYVLLFLIIGGLAIISTLGSKPLRLAGAVAAIVLALFAGMTGDSVDYFAYEGIFNAMSAADNLDWPIRILIGKDPLFGTLVLGTVMAGAGVQLMFLSSALIGISIKWRAFERVFESAAVPFFVLLCGYFFLHEFTQIRAGIALGFCFISLVLKCEGGHDRAAFAWAFLAVGFHASVVLYLILMWIVTMPPRRAWIWSGAVVALLLLGARAASSVIAQFDTRTEDQLSATGSSITPLLIAAVRLAILAWIWSDLRKRSDENARLLQACMILCIAAVPFLVVLRGLSSVMAFRFYELFDAFSVFILSASLLRGSVIAQVASLALCAASMFIHFHDDLIPSYVFGSF